MLIGSKENSLFSPGGYSRGSTWTPGGVRIAPVYSPTTSDLSSVSLTLPSPRRFPERWSPATEVGKVPPVVVGVSDSGTTRLLPSYRLSFLSMESSCHRLSRSRTHASRLRSTTHARYREEKRNRRTGFLVRRETNLAASTSSFCTTECAARLQGNSME